MEYWLTEFRLDGFRFDLSKGFTQVFNTDVGQWSNYDASRIAILKEYADVMWAASPGAYVILEHLGANNEETELANYGMMLWGNLNYDYNEATMGYNSNLTWGSYQERGWNDPHLVTYMESHDEERLMFKNLEYGNSSGDYNVKNRTTALQRIELASTFFYTIPGPKMLWQFGELGYEIPINYCPNGNIDPGCRVDPKPILWEYQEDPRRERLYNVTKALIDLKTSYDVFNTDDFDLNVSNGQWKWIHLFHPSMDVAVQGNFFVEDRSVPTPFPHDGWWYEYFTGDSLQVNDPNASLTLAPGEYRLYTTVRLEEPPGGFISSTEEVVRNHFNMQLVPNPTSGAVQLTYELEQAAQVDVQLFNLMGQPVASYLGTRLGSGQHQLQIDQDLPAGIYLVKLRVDNLIETKRLIVK